MSTGSVIMGGLIATTILTVLIQASQSLHLTRMDLPYMLGTMFTPNRDKAKVYGVILHFINGLVFATLYTLSFYFLHLKSWWWGLAFGLLHTAFVLSIGMAILPGIHPRMASVQHGPTVVRQLEPPGFLALNYGLQTPLVMLISHLIFGAVIGVIYQTVSSRAFG